MTTIGLPLYILRCTTLVILGATATLKLLSITYISVAHARLLSQSNFILPFLSERSVLIIGVLLELTIIALFLFTKNNLLQYGFLTSLSAIFTCYHYAASLCRTPCHCVGFWDPKNVLENPRVTLILILILFTCSVAGLLLALRRSVFTQQCA